MAKISTLIDDFEDGVINTSLWGVTGSVAETGGNLVITPTSGFSYLLSDFLYDLTESKITIHVPSATATGMSGTLECGMGLDLNANNQVFFYKREANILCASLVAGVPTVHYSAPYNSLTHVYWRFRESAGIFYWEASQTGTSWTILFSATVSTNLFPVTNVGVAFWAGWSSGFELSPGTFQIASVNAGLSITASGASTSSGAVAFRLLHAITGSGASTSTGTLAFTIPPLGSHALTASATSSTTGTLAFIILAPGQMTASATSTSSGNADLLIVGGFTASAFSFSVGTATLTIIPAGLDPSIPVQYFTFEPPVAYDLPATLPDPKPRYINAHARWKGGQRRGRSVLKHGSTYTTLDSPTVDQINASDSHYLGGHIYTVTQEEANALSAAGFTVAPLPDRIAPILTILSPPSGANVDKRVRVNLLTSEIASVIGTLTGNGLTYPITVPSAHFSITTEDLPQGSYRLQFTATDLVGLSVSAYVDINVLHAGATPTPHGICIYPATSIYPALTLFPTFCEDCLQPSDYLYPADSLLPIYCEPSTPESIPSTTLLPSVLLLPGTP